VIRCERSHGESRLLLSRALTPTLTHQAELTDDRSPTDRFTDAISTSVKQSETARLLSPPVSPPPSLQHLFPPWPFTSCSPGTFIPRVEAGPGLPFRVVSQSICASAASIKCAMSVSMGPWDNLISLCVVGHDPSSYLYRE
jgi:hypothetical protein